MIGLHPDCPPGVTLLADHLDAALAIGEDLLASSLPARADLDAVDADKAPEALDVFVRDLMQLEAALLLRLLQARRLSAEIGRDDNALRAAGNLFRAQTEVLQELIDQARPSGPDALARPGDSHVFIRARGLIPPEAAAPSPFEGLSVGESFKVGAIAPLGQMLDLVSSLLDLLDARYGLYPLDLVDEETISLGTKASSDEAKRAVEDALPVAEASAGAGEFAEAAAGEAAIEPIRAALIEAESPRQDDAVMASDATVVDAGTPVDKAASSVASKSAQALTAEARPKPDIEPSRASLSARLADAEQPA